MNSQSLNLSTQRKERGIRKRRNSEKKKEKQPKPKTTERKNKSRTKKYRLRKMQRKIDNNMHLGQTVSPFHSIGSSSAIHRRASDFDNANKKAKKINRLVYTGGYDEDIPRYITGTLQ